MSQIKLSDMQLIEETCYTDGNESFGVVHQRGRILFCLHNKEVCAELPIHTAIIKSHKLRDLSLTPKTHLEESNYDQT